MLGTFIMIFCNAFTHKCHYDIYDYIIFQYRKKLAERNSPEVNSSFESIKETTQRNRFFQPERSLSSDASFHVPFQQGTCWAPMY